MCSRLFSRVFLLHSMVGNNVSMDVYLFLWLIWKLFLSLDWFVCYAFGSIGFVYWHVQIIFVHKWIVSFVSTKHRIFTYCKNRVFIHFHNTKEGGSQSKCLETSLVEKPVYKRLKHLSRALQVTSNVFFKNFGCSSASDDFLAMRVIILGLFF